MLTERISPCLVADPRVNGSIAPINRDLRFDPNGPRYKDHLLFRWWEDGGPKKTAPTLFDRLDPIRIGFASGITFSSTDRWRAAVGDATAARTLATLVHDMRHDARVPAPYPADHLAADLLRHKSMFQLRWTEPLPAAASTPALVEHYAARLTRFTDLHHWLHQEVTP